MGAARGSRSKGRTCILTDEEEEILALAREFNGLRASSPSWGGLHIDAVAFLQAAVRAERAVANWWTPERWRRMFGRTPSDPEGERVPTPFEGRPTPQEIIRDLLPLVRPRPEDLEGLSDEDALRRIVDSPIVFRAPSILAEMERLAVRKACGEEDALDGIVSALHSRRRRGRRSAPIHEREWLRRFRLIYSMDLSQEQMIAKVGGRREGSRWPELSPKQAAALLALERYWKLKNQTAAVTVGNLDVALAHVDSLEKLARRHGYVQSSPATRRRHKRPN